MGFLTILDEILRRRTEALGSLGLIAFLLICPLSIESSHSYQAPFVMAASPPAIFQPTSGSFITNYTIPIPKNSVPDAIVPGPNGTLWFTEYHAGMIGEFNATSMTFMNYTIPEPGALPVTLTFDGSNQIWFTDQNPNSPSIWRFDIQKPATFTRFLTNAANSSPVFVLADQATKNIWFTDTPGGYIGEINQTTLSMTRFPAPTAQSGPVEIARQNGTSYIWASEISGKIARFDMLSHSFQEFTPSVPLSYPVGIVVDTHGYVWISEHGGSAIAEFMPSNSTWRKYPTSQATATPGTGPATLAIDSRGRLWFAEHYANKIGRLDPNTSEMDEFAIPLAGAYSLLNSLDGAGNFWFAMAYADSIGMIPGNASSSIGISLLSAPRSPVTAGQTIASRFMVTNNLSTQVTMNLGVTSFFTTNYYTTSSEVSLSTNTLTLGPGQNTTITASVTPDFSLTSGLYTAGIVASYDGISSSATFFLQVNDSPWYQLETLLPEILITISTVLVIAFLLVRRRRSRPPIPAKSTPKATLAIVLTIVFLLFIQGTGQSWAKCPGLPSPPPPPTQSGGTSAPGSGTSGPDFYGIALDIGSIAFFAVVAYFLIRERLRGRGTNNGTRTPSSPRSEQ